MAVTKRIRYEVLRRDNHTCRYCHATDSPLTVDHVTPVALGGSDAPDNLVAACRDCNAGKSSANPDSSLVADVRQDALRHAELLRQTYALLVERITERHEYVEAFEQVYRLPLPVGWHQTIERWHDMGVPVEVVTDAAEKVSRRQFRTADDRFKYMCGIVWKQVTVADETAELKRYILGAFVTEDSLCDQRIAAYLEGYDKGAACQTNQRDAGLDYTWMEMR